MTTSTLEEPTIDAGEETSAGSTRPRPPRSAGISRGTALGRYLVLERLGHGGMGIVYSAYDPVLDRKVALKLVAAPVGDRRSREGHERLLREAQSMARLTHPNVVTVHDVGVVEDAGQAEAGRVFVAMELVDGVTLRQWLRAEPRPWREVLRVLLAAGRGLAAAHDKGLVHRDFKPDNVMVDRSGRVLVMDFGLALSEAERDPGSPVATDDGDGSVPGRTSSRVTVGGRVLGTPAYMSPEQHLRRAADPRSDQFSFCVTAYQALLGQHPFEGDGAVQLSTAMLAGALRPDPKGSPVPTWVRRHLRRGLAPSPEDRFASMDALLAALEADPRKRRRTALVVAVGLSAVAGGVALQQLRGAWAEQACDEAGRTIDRVWNDDARQRVASRLRETSAPYADTTVDSVTASLDEWTGQWAEQRTELCRAVELRQEASAELGRDALACLDESRAAAEHLVTVLADRAESVERAVPMVLELPRPEACTDERDLARRVRPPESLEASVRELRHALARTRVRRGSGDVVGAAAQLDALRQQAVEIGWAPALAAVDAERGVSLEGLGKLDEAAAALEAAYFSAGAHGDDLVALLAATDLTRTVGHRLARADEGLRWGQHAQMMLERLGLQGTHYESRLLHHLATVHNQRGSHDEAITLMLRAQALITERFGDDHPMLVNPLNNLGITYGMVGRLAESAQVLAQAEQLGRRSSGADHPTRAAALNNLGTVRIMLGEHQAAEEALQESRRIYVRLYGEQHPDVGMTEVQLADIRAARGDLRGALAMLQTATASITAAFGEHHEHHAASRMRMAEVLRALDDLPGAEQQARRGVEIFARVFGPNHSETLRAEAALARIVGARGDRATARASLDRVQRALAETATAEHSSIHALVMLWRAQLALDDGDLEQARTLGEEALTRLQVSEASTGEQADGQLLVARAAPEHERARARMLAQAALDTYRSLGALYAESAQRAERWLAEHPAVATPELP